MAHICTEPALFDGKFQAHRVVEPTLSVLKTHVQDLVRNLSPQGRFPGPNPCSLERADLSALLRAPYWICEKTDGTRALAVFLHFDGVNLALMVTRAWDVYVVGARHVPRAMFQGTVLDGEIVRGSKGWIWLGFDGIVVSGIPVWKAPLSTRVRAVHRALKAYRFDVARDKLELRFKNYYASCDQYANRRLTPDAATATDGIVLTPERDPVIVGRHPALFKLKPPGKHTVDFQFLTPNVLCVYCPKARGSVSVGTLSALSYRAATAPLRSGSIVEALWTGKGTVWDLITERHDKTTSNDVLTHAKTLLNARENLTFDDVRLHLIDHGHGTPAPGS